MNIIIISVITVILVVVNILQYRHVEKSIKMNDELLDLVEYWKNKANGKN